MAAYASKEVHDGSDYGWVTPPVAAYASGGGKGMRGKGIGRSVGQACFAYPDLGFISKTTRSSWTYICPDLRPPHWPKPLRRS